MGVRTMNLTITLPILLTIVGMSGGFMYAVIRFSMRFGTWAGELQQMMRDHAKAQASMNEDIVSLRKSRHDHGEKIMVLDTRMGVAEDDIGELRIGRRHTDTEGKK